MPISNQNAAQRIVADLIEDGFFIDFVETLIRINTGGLMGRAYALKGLNDVVTGLIQEGYSYDEATGQFFENQRERISQNWGRLKDGDEQRMTILRLDIVGNSSLVKQNSGDHIEKAYTDLRAIVSKSVISRLGRLWSWEGDGALAAFMFGKKEQAAVFCGMDILHELFFYNRLKNPLNKPIKVRIGVHVGMIRYHDNVIERLKNETIKQALTLEAEASADSMGLSHNLFISLEPSILDLFSPEKPYRGGRYRLYNVSLGQA
jgi:hypothetical protein